MTRVVTTVNYYDDLNTDDELRINIIGLSGDWSGGIERFDGLEAYQLQQLIDENFMTETDRHNSAPENKEILEFLQQYPDFTAGGYAVSPERQDYRISLESISLDREPTVEEREAFTYMCRYADEFRCDSSGCYAWFD